MVARNAPQEWHYYRTFHGGLNTSTSANLIAENELSETRNAVLGAGFISKRDGFTKAAPNAATGAVKGLFNAYKSDGTQQFLYATSAALGKIDGTGNLAAIPFGGALTTLAGGAVDFLSYKQRPVGGVINDMVLLADGGKLKMYNYTNVTEVVPYTPPTDTTDANYQGLNDLANLTNFRAVEVKKDRIFAAAHSTVKNRLHFTHRDVNIGYAAYDYWPAAFFFDVATDENDEIIALKTFRDYIIIFCKRSIWALAGDGTKLNDYEIIRINVPKGCIAANSIHVVENEIFYLAEDGVYALFATSQNTVSARLVSESITPSLNSVTLSDRRTAAGAYTGHIYMLSMPDGTTFVYDTNLKAWTVWTNVKATCCLVLDGVIYFGTTTGYIYKFVQNQYNDDGAAIDFFIRTKNHDFGKPTYLKQLIRIVTKSKQFDVPETDIDLTVIFDGSSFAVPQVTSDSSFVWDVGDWDVTNWDFTDVTTATKYVSKLGREIQYTVRNNYLDQPCVIYEIDTQFMTLRV